MAYVGCGHGAYITETTYKYVGCGGDYSRPKRDFTCIIAGCCCLSLLLLIPLLCWLLMPEVNCTDMAYSGSWTMDERAYCCAAEGIGCTTRPTTALPETTPTVPPTPFPTPPPTPPPTLAPAPPATPSGPVDPFNCAVGAENSWAADKKGWCCRIHHRGCPPIVPPPAPVPLPIKPADPFDCAAGFANWQAGWAVAKKEWCCRVHGKGCNNGGGGCVTIVSTSAPFDCNAGFANWMAGWSVAKKAWCCTNAGKGCPPTAGGCA